MSFPVSQPTRTASEARRRKFTQVRRQEEHRLRVWEFIDRNDLGIDVPGEVLCDLEPDKRVPIEPFREWLTRKVAEHGDQKRLAALLDIGVRHLSRCLGGSELNGVVGITTVDKALTREGSTFLWQLYPELYPGLVVPSLAVVLESVCQPGSDEAWLHGAPGTAGHRRTPEGGKRPVNAYEVIA